MDEARALGQSARWSMRLLPFKGQTVSFIVNRSTDFFWEFEDFSALRGAYQSGRVYVAPNPFTYATRSNKRLLEWLSLPDRDKELEIEPEERQILSDHVPETHLIRADNLEGLAKKSGNLSSNLCMDSLGAGYSAAAPWGGRAFTVS